MAKDKGKGKGGKDKPAEGDAETEAPEGADGAAEDGGKKKLPLKLILIAAGAAVIVLGGGGTAAFLLLAPKPDAAHAHQEHKPKKDEKKEGKADDKTAPQIKDGPDGVVFFTMPDIVVNMQTADGKPTFLKLKLTFEVPDHDTAEAMTPEAPRMKDMFQTFLRELRPEDLQGSQGSFALRTELQRRVNLIIAPSKVNAVLIEEMLIN